MPKQEDMDMEFSFDVKSLTDPKKRLLLGILLLAAGAVFGLTGILPLLFEVLKRKESAREMK